MNAPAQIESQVKHILRMYEDVELEEKFIDLCLEWLNKGLIEGARIARHVDNNQEEIKP